MVRHAGQAFTNELGSDNRRGQNSRAFFIGMVAGLRSMTAPAVTSRMLATNGFEALGPKWVQTLARPATARKLAFAAASELLVDKLPITPNRTAVPSLLWRILSGAVCGAALAHTSGGRMSKGAIAGGTGAVVGSYAGEKIRRIVGEVFGIPDVLVGVGEDAVTAAAAFSVARSLQPPRRLERIPA